MDDLHFDLENMLPELEAQYLCHLEGVDFFSLILASKTLSKNFKFRAIRGKQILKEFSSRGYVGLLSYAKNSLQMQIDVDYIVPACNYDRIDVIVWYLGVLENQKRKRNAIDPGMRNHVALAEAALRIGSPLTVEHFASKFNIIPTILDIFSSKSMRRSSIFLRLKDKYKMAQIVEFAQHLLKIACFEGSPALLDFLFENRLVNVSMKKNYMLSVGSNPALFDWLVAKGETIDGDYLDFKYKEALHSQDLEFVKYLAKSHNCSISNKSIIDIYEDITKESPDGSRNRIRLDFLEFLLSQGFYFDNRLIKFAIKSDQYDLFQWALIKQGPLDKSDTSIVKWAVKAIFEKRWTWGVVTNLWDPSVKTKCVRSLDQEHSRILMYLLENGFKVPDNIYRIIIEKGSLGLLLALDEDIDPEQSIRVHSLLFAVLDVFYDRGIKIKPSDVEGCRSKQWTGLLTILKTLYGLS